METLLTAALADTNDTIKIQSYMPHNPLLPGKSTMLQIRSHLYILPYPTTLRIHPSQINHTPCCHGRHHHTHTVGPLPAPLLATSHHCQYSPPINAPNQHETDHPTHSPRTATNATLSWAPQASILTASPPADYALSVQKKWRG